jgi:hypothetical protein
MSIRPCEKKFSASATCFAAPSPGPSGIEEDCRRRFYFDNQLNMLDQFLANKSMPTVDAAIKVDRSR